MYLCVVGVYFLILVREKIVGFGVDVLRKQREFFLDDLELIFIFYIFLEEEVFLVDDYDVVNSEKSRRKRVEVFFDIFEKDGSELILESFFFVLRDY